MSTRVLTACLVPVLMRVFGCVQEDKVMTAGNGAENLSPSVSQGLGEVSILPEAQAVKVRQEVEVRQEVGPQVSPEVRPHSSPPTSSTEFTSTSVLTIGPPVTVGSKRKLADSPLDSLASSPHDPNANPKVTDLSMLVSLYVGCSLCMHLASSFSINVKALTPPKRQPEGL